MTWNELKPLIEDDFLSRELKDPSIRLRALDNIEALLKVHMPELLNDILAICNIEKKEFKKLIAHYKGKELNGAEKSVINDIYRHCQGIEYDIQVALQSQNIQNNRYGNGSNNIENNKEISFPVGKLLIFLFFIICLCVTYCDGNSDKPLRQTDVQASVRMYLRNNLSDWDSYKSISWSNFSNNGEEYSILHKYKAKNMFGGYVTKVSRFYVNQEGVVIYVDEYQ